MANRRRIQIAIGCVVLVVAAVLGTLLLRHRGETAPSPRAIAMPPVAGVAKRTRATISATDLAPAAATGTLRLEGQVIDDHDQPVPGADVVVTTGHKHVKAEQDGSFAFDGLVEDQYHLGARAGDLISDMVEIRLTAKSEPVILHVRRGSTLTLHVVDDRGPIAGATIEIDDDEVVAGTTDATGISIVHGIRPPWLFVAATADGYAKEHMFVRFADTPGGSIERTLTLKRGAPVAGIVLDPGGKPVADATVEIARPHADWRQVVQSDARGAFRVAAVPAGAYVASATSEIYGEGERVKLDLDGTSPREGVTLHVAYDAQLVGVVVDASGKPVADARVEAMTGIFPRYHVQSGVDGRFAMLGITATTYTVIASHGTLSSPDTTVSIGNDERVDLKLVVADTGITGTVVDETGAPVHEAHVFATTDLPSGHQSTDITDSAGHFVIGELPPGTYRVTAGWTWLSSLVERTGPVVATGTHDVRLVLDSAATVTGRVLLDDQPVTFYGVEAVDHKSISNGLEAQGVRSSDGRFTLRNQTPRTCDIAVLGPGTARKVISSVKLEAGKTTDLGDIALAHGQRITGHVRDSSGAAVEGATVEIDDRPGRPAQDSVAAMFEGAFATMTGADGSYAFDGIASVSVPHMPATIIATHPTHGSSARVPLPAGDATVDLALIASGGIDGTVTGQVPPGTSVLVVHGPDIADRQQVSVDPDGTFSVDGLVPGDYAVSVGVGIGYARTSDVTVAVQSNERVKVTLAMPTVGVTLDVTVSGGSCQLIALFKPGDGPRQAADVVASSPCSMSGAELHGIQAGNYRLCLDARTCTPIAVAAAPAIQAFTLAAAK